MEIDKEKIDTQITDSWIENQREETEIVYFSISLFIISPPISPCLYTSISPSLSLPSQPASNIHKERNRMKSCALDVSGRFHDFWFNYHILSKVILWVSSPSVIADPIRLSKFSPVHSLLLALQYYAYLLSVVRIFRYLERKHPTQRYTHFGHYGNMQMS